MQHMVSILISDSERASLAPGLRCSRLSSSPRPFELPRVENDAFLLEPRPLRVGTVFSLIGHRAGVGKMSKLSTVVTLSRLLTSCTLCLNTKRNGCP